MEPDITESNVNYICFTDDSDLQSDNWEIKYINEPYDPNLLNRKIKILPHLYLPSCSYSVYVDGNIRIKSKLKPLVEHYLNKADIAVYTHPTRESVFREAQMCINTGKVSRSTAIQQMRSYKQAGFSDSIGLSENRVVYRRHGSDDLISTMHQWWQEVSNKTHRDQLSLMFVLWKTDMQFNLIQQTVQDSSNFQIHPHKPPGLRGIFWSNWITVREKRTEKTYAALLWYVSRPGYYFVRSVKIISQRGISTYISKLNNFVHNVISD
jgi:hypothetical protein